MEAIQSSPLPNIEYLQDNEKAAKKLEDFLSTLPKERGWVASHLYNYQGYWLIPSHIKIAIAFQTNFQAINSDIFLVTSPKSGATWLKAIAFAVLNRVQYCVASPQHPLLNHNPHDLVPFLEYEVYAKSDNPNLSSYTSPRLFSTHFAYVSLPQSIKDSKCKIVYVCRNPKDTFVSYWHFTNKLRAQTQTMEQNSMDEMFELFCKGVSPFGPYWEHALEYWEKSLEMHENVFFLKYEDMKKEPLLYLKKLAGFLGCPFSLEEEVSRVPDEILKLCSFDNLSNLEVNMKEKLSTGVENKAFFRRGEVGDWKNFLSDEMVNVIDNIAEEKFKASGLEFQQS